MKTITMDQLKRIQKEGLIHSNGEFAVRMEENGIRLHVLCASTNYLLPVVYRMDIVNFT